MGAPLQFNEVSDEAFRAGTVNHYTAGNNKFMCHESFLLGGTRCLSLKIHRPSGLVSTSVLLLRRPYTPSCWTAVPEGYRLLRHIRRRRHRLDITGHIDYCRLVRLYGLLQCALDLRWVFDTDAKTPHGTGDFSEIDIFENP